MKTKRGFTLVEVIVVIAVMTIVGAVAVPSSLSAISNAAKNACTARIDTMNQAYYQLYADKKAETGGSAVSDELEKNLYETAIQQVLDNPAQDPNGDYVDRSSGCRYYYDKVTTEKVPCRIHSAIIFNFSPAAAKVEGFRDALDTIVPGADRVARVDSTTPSTNPDRTAQINQAFNDAGFAAAGVKTWSYTKTWEIYMSNVDINDYEVGDYIPVIRFNANTGNLRFRGTYTVWFVKVEEYTINGVTYKRMDTSDSTKKEYTVDKPELPATGNCSDILTMDDARKRYETAYMQWIKEDPKVDPSTYM